ncbi:MAG: ribonuclease E/G [Lachnospiraceae bacterium]|nr:ribonuclease E/G [Lachnospiraceae bacterium]
MIRAIITGYKGKRLLALKDEEGFLSFKLCSGSSLTGSIINGRVDKRAENLNACFVRLSAQEYGYLPTSEIKAQTTLPVQIVKDGRGDKKYLLTRQLSIAGRYTVIFKEADKPVLFSKRISSEGKQRILEELKDTEPLSYPVLFRANCGRADFFQVSEEMRELSGIMDSILKLYDKRPDYSVLYSPKDELIRDLYDIEYDRLSEVITDSEEVYELVKREYHDTLPEEYRKRIRLTLYRDELLPLSGLVNLKAGLERARDKRVWLKSGSYIIIEQTEALVSIDVNSGKNEGKGLREDVILRINEEAAEEIARQLRLRNLSGIIIIDFINMKTRENNEKLIRSLKKALKTLETKAVFMDMTKLGLVELTRKREGKSLEEMTAQINHQFAPEG